MAVNIGPKIGIDGEAQFRKELNNIIQQSKTLSSEMKAVTSAFDKNDNSQEKLAAQSAVLTKQIETQEQRIEQLKKGLAASAKEFGEADTRTQKWKQAVNDATSELNNMRSNLKGLDTAVDDTADSLDDAADSALSFGDVLKANVLSQAIVNGVKELASAFGSLIKNTVSYNAQIEQYTMALTTALGDETKAAETLAKIREDAAKTPYSVESLVKANQLLISTNGNAEKSRKTIIALSNAISATGGGDDELIRMAQNLQQISNSGKATTEDIKQFAYAGIDIYGLLSDYTGKSVQECKELEISYDLLSNALEMAATEGGKYFGANEAQAQTLNGKISTLKDNIQDGLGTAMQGINDVFGKLVSIAIDLVEEIDWKKFGENVTSTFQFLMDNGGKIASLVASIGAAFISWNVGAMIQGVISSITALGGILPALKTAILGVNAALKANPIGLVLTGISLLVAGIIALWNNCDWFRDGVITIGNAIVDFISDAVDGIVHFFTVTVPQAFNKVLDFVKTNWQGLLLLLVNPFAGAFKLLYDNFEGFRNAVNTLVERIKTAFINMKDGISNTVRNIKDAIVNGFQAAVDFITSLPGKAVQWGRDFIQGLVDGIISMASRVVDAVKGIANTITSWLHFSRPDVGPLRDYETWMPDMVQGMAEGVRANAYKLENAVASMAEGMSVNVNGKAGASNMGGVYITVNGAPGQDENRLADIIMLKIQNATARREAVW